MQMQEMHEMREHLKDPTINFPPEKNVTLLTDLLTGQLRLLP